MGDKSKIEWTDASWTPIRARYWEIQADGSGKERIGWHCEHASDGCRFCYAEGMNIRLGTGMEFKPGNLYRPEREGYANGGVKVFLDERMLLAPLRWKKPRMIFVCSMTDLFADFVKDEWIDKIFAVMAAAPQHTFQVLTKRAERMREYLSQGIYRRLFRRVDLVNDLLKASGFINPERLLTDGPLKHVWLGVSAERQQEADERIPLLLQTPAAVRFVSLEPLLGPIDLIGTLARFQDTPKRRCAVPLGAQLIDWVIVGGESGPNARPMHPQWARDLRDQCAAAGVPFFFKQWGEHIAETVPGTDVDLTKLPRNQAIAWGDGKTNHTRYTRVGKRAAGRLLDGVEHSEFPEVRT